VRICFVRARGGRYVLDRTQFDVQVYPEAMHVFLYRQDLGRNQAATEDGWPRAMAFFKRQLMTAAATR
jgi:dienelactone hydrolase